MTRMEGPLFNGQADSASDALCDDMSRDVAQRGVDMVRANLDGVLKHPTGRYRSSIVSTRVNPSRITDGGSVYGPWLEGTSSRNRTTRFKGYSTFRRTAQQLGATATRGTDQLVASRVREMNR